MSREPGALHFQFWGGVPSLTVPDNTRTGVTKASRYDPDINPTYQNLAVHYGFGVVPARPYRPRDKAKVERTPQPNGSCRVTGARPIS